MYNTCETKTSIRILNIEKETATPSNVSRKQAKYRFNHIKSIERNLRYFPHDIKTKTS